MEFTINLYTAVHSNYKAHFNQNRIYSQPAIHTNMCSPMSMSMSSDNSNDFRWVYPTENWSPPTTEKVRIPYIVVPNLHYGDRLEIYTIPDSPAYYYNIFDGFMYKCGWMLASSEEEAGEKVFWEYYMECDKRLRLAHESPKHSPPFMNITYLYNKGTCEKIEYTKLRGCPFVR